MTSQIISTPGGVLPWRVWLMVWLDEAARAWVGPSFVALCGAVAAVLVYFFLFRRRDVEGAQEEVEEVEEEEEEEERPRTPRARAGRSEQALKDLQRRAEEREEAGDAKGALSLYLAVLHDAAEGGVVSKQTASCLHRAAWLAREDTGKHDLAVRLLQAEKFLYENALLSYAKTSATTSKVLSGALYGQGKDAAIDRCDSLRELALLFLSRSEPMAALSYAIKAYSLRLRRAGEVAEAGAAEEAAAAMEEKPGRAIEAVLLAAGDDTLALATGVRVAPAEYAVLRRCYD
eukprot:Hpha_TRINITY_DN16598_c1_g13::TRINITY_DN16598_c1_g13_i1::g.132928::m.132928